MSPLVLKVVILVQNSSLIFVNTDDISSSLNKKNMNVLLR